MIYWIKRTAFILGVGAFFIVFFLGIDFADIFNPETLAVALLKGIAGAALFWTMGFIIGDIVLKGIVTDAQTDENDTAEGGIIQRLHSVKTEQVSETIPETDVNHNRGKKSARVKA
jgi:hypothetical protein